MKDVAYCQMMRTAGILTRWVSAGNATMFCFHLVTPARATAQQESSLSVSAKFLAALVARLRNADIPIILIAEAVARRRSHTRGSFAVLTFDDGYRDNGEVLHPLMERLQVDYTIFVTTGLVDGSMPLWWDGIEQLVQTQNWIVLDGGTLPLPAPHKAAVDLPRLSGEAWTTLELTIAQRTMVQFLTG